MLSTVKSCTSATHVKEPHEPQQPVKLSSHNEPLSGKARPEDKRQMIFTLSRV